MESYTYRDFQGARMRRRAAQREQQKRRIIAAVRTISGAAAILFFFLIYCKAGASDCGAAWEEIFPSTLYYTLAFGLSVSVYNYLDQFR